MPETLDRRQALIIAAFAAIAERGFEGLRLRPIAAAVGIDHSTLHHYFPAKVDLIAAVIGYVTSQFEATMRGDLPPAARLRHHLAEVARAVAERPELFVVLDEIDLRARRDKPMAAATARDEQGWREALATIFEEGADQHLWSVDIDASVELVIAAVKGIRLRPETAEAVVRQLCDLFSPEA